MFILVVICFTSYTSSSSHVDIDALDVSERGLGRAARVTKGTIVVVAYGVKCIINEERVNEGGIGVEMKEGIGVE